MGSKSPNENRPWCVELSKVVYAHRQAQMTSDLIEVLESRLMRREEELAKFQSFS